LSSTQKYYTTREASALLFVHQNTILRYIHIGLLPAINTGQEGDRPLWKIPREAVWKMRKNGYDVRYDSGHRKDEQS
jgi:excisionase family DNA binding protein